MCAKQLYVKSNGQWVAAGGAGGSVDTAGLATEQFVTDAIGAGGFATLTDLNDALANIPESAITLHAGAVPDAGADTPQGLEDGFSVLDDGLHYFKDVGTLVSITRQEYQTTIVLSGQLTSFAKIVKSEAGLPTPQNPSMIVMQRAEGQWLKLTSDALDEPFGKPQQVDIFALTGGYTKPEVDGLIAGKADQSEFAAFQGQYGTLESEFREYFRLLNQGFATVVQKDDVYTKTEVDAKLEADKDFSIANDNVLLGQITSLQEIVSNLGTEIGTGQIDVLDAIRDVEIEPSMVSLTGDANSPIAWKGGLSLTPAKEGDHWRLNWNDGKAIHTLVHGDEFTSANIIAALVSQDVSVSNLQTGGLELSELFMGAAGDRLITQVAGGPENTVAYLSDLSGYAPITTTALITTQLQAVFDSIYTRAESDDRYAKRADNTQNIVANAMVAKGYTFGDAISTGNPGLVYIDTNEGYGPRLVLDTPGGKELIPYQSDFEPVNARLAALESTTVDAYTKAQVDTKLAAINPTSAANINDPALAAFKKSVLDEVKLMLAGGTKMPPADISWTPIIRMDGTKETTSTQIEARMLGGFIELKGTLTFTAGSGAWVPLRLPPQFPLAELEAKYPLAMRLVGSAVTYGYCTVSKTNRDISVSPGAQSSEAAFSGIRWKAAY
jgi:hypothetical protein